MRSAICVLVAVVAGLGSPLEHSKRSDGDLNIPDPVEVSKDDKKLYEAYGNFTKYLTEGLELKASPCDNFYNYTCKNINFSEYFTRIEEANFRNIEEGLQKSAEGAPQWYQKLKKQYDDCLSHGKSQRDGEFLKKSYAKIKADLGSVFPLFDGSSSASHGAAGLGELVGYLAQKFDLHTLLSYRIEGSRLFLDEPKLAFPERYFSEAFDQFETEYKASIKDYLQQLAEALEKTVDITELDATIDKVVNFEKDLAILLARVTKEGPVRTSFSELSKHSGSVDLNTYFNTITKNAGFFDSFMSKDITVHLSSPSKSALMQKYISQADPAIVFNYLNIRLARSLRKHFMRKPKECVADQWLREGKGVKNIGVIPPRPKQDPYILAGSERDCIYQLYETLQHAVDRVYLDQNLPIKEGRKKLVDRIKVITSKIKNGFRFQLDQLSWFSPKVKAAAYKKVDAMLYNVVYDDWIENDDLLNQEYGELIDSEEEYIGSDKFTTTEKLRDFAQSKAFKKLLGDDDRHQNFTLPLATVDAWYDPNINHFYVPLGILQRPFFDINYPAAIQYGGVGYFIGHELTHGFDSNGVNYDDQGKYNPWMDKPSQAKFNEMADCVVAEYNKIHGRGNETKTEDIADNGGLRSAYNAFKAEQELRGPNPQLPGRPLDEFTQDQLFFLGFAHVWCSNDPTFDIGDVHSPFFARVLGSLQNFPAFQAAFNCPAGSAYAPKKHCDVWASEVGI